MDEEGASRPAYKAGFGLLALAITAILAGVIWWSTEDSTRNESDGPRWVATDGREYVHVGRGDCVEEEQQARRNARFFEEEYDGIYLVIAQYDGGEAECVTGRRVREDGATVYRVEDPHFVEWIGVRER